MRSRWTQVAVTVLLVALVNVPYLHGRWVEHRLHTDGVDVTVAVDGHLSTGGRYVLGFADERLRADGRATQVRVTRPAYDAAVAAGSTTVTVLPGEPGRFEVAGQVPSHGALLFTLAADALVALALLLSSRRGPRRPELVMRATADLVPCEPGTLLERLVGNEHVVAGLVLETGPHEVLVDLGDRRVRVVLDGHTNPVGVREPARATGVLIG